MIDSLDSQSVPWLVDQRAALASSAVTIGGAKSASLEPPSTDPNHRAPPRLGRRGVDERAFVRVLGAPFRRRVSEDVIVT